MSKWYMLTLVGQDRTGIVSRVTAVLYELGCQLGETSMMRLGGNFTMMLMTRFDGDIHLLRQQLEATVKALQLHLHIDAIDGRLHDHVLPGLQISVYGADQPGIVAKVTTLLEQQQFNILDLESDVAGTEQKPVYIMHIEGVSPSSEAEIIKALKPVIDEGIDIKVTTIDTLVG